MATLNGNAIADTFKYLLKTAGSESPLDDTFQAVQDGIGTDSKLEISTTGVKSTGTLEVTGTATLSTSVVLATGATVTGIDNGDLATGSATLLATQGAVKTYVDAQVGASDTLAEVLANGGTATSSALAGVMSDETGSGSLVFASSPTLVTPALGTPASGVATNLTGTALGLTAGTVTTNANLTGEVTSAGNAATIADDVVDEANLKVSNAPTNGYVLSAQSGDTGGLTWVDNTHAAGTVTSVSGAGTVNGLTLTGTVTSSGSLTLGGTLASVANSALTNSSVTVGTTSISLGASSTTLAGLTSVTSTVFVGALTGKADTVTTNANLTGGVTSVGNAATVITNANLTGGVTSVGNAATVITNANLTGEVTSVGNAATIADDTVDEANLKSDNAPTDDYVLTAKSSAAGGLTWAESSGGGGVATVYAQQFTGNGIITAFTLLQTPAGENNTQVYISGVYQQKGTYTVSGTTLTFATAPADEADNIEVITTATSSIGTTTSDLVTFSPSGTGATDRTTQAKLRDTVNVKDFGATGDGSTDDTTDIAAAITAVGTAGAVDFTQVGATDTTYKVADDVLGGGGNKFIANFTGARLVNTTGATESAAGLYPKGTSLIGFTQTCPNDETTYYQVYIPDDTVDSEGETTGTKVNGIKGHMKFGDSGTTGGRHAIYGLCEQNAATSSSNTDRNYVGIQGIAKTVTGDGGTAVEHKGGYFGMSSHTIVTADATYVDNMTAFEANVQNLSTTTDYVASIQTANRNTSQGVTYDSHLALSNIAGGSYVGSKHGILFGAMNGEHPVATTGTLIGTTGTAAVTNGIDFDSYTFTGNILQATGIQITPTSMVLTGVSHGLELGNLGTGNTPFIDFHSSGFSNDYDSRILGSAGVTGVIGSGTIIHYAAAHVFTGYDGAGVVQPAADGEVDLGGASNRWDTVYATTGTINTSDERQKQDITELSDAEKRVAVAIKGLIRKFRFKSAVTRKGEDKARYHIGVVAQDVQAAFEAEGLDATEYGLFCYDEWEESSGVGADLETTTNPAGNSYGVRYDELLAFVISAI